MKRFLILVFIVFCVSKSYSQIDTAQLAQFYQLMKSNKTSERKWAVSYISNNARYIEPHTLLMIADVVYKLGYKDSAVYWFYLGSIRSRYLLSLYKDPSAWALYGALHQTIGEKIKLYAGKHLKTLSEKMIQALDWDRNNPLDPTLFMENPTDTTKYISSNQWQKHYDSVRNAYLELSQDVLKDNFMEKLNKNEY